MSRKRSKIGKEKSTVYRKAYLSMSLKVFSGTLVQQSIHSSSLCAAATESAMFDVDEDMNPVAVFRWLGRKQREHRLGDNVTPHAPMHIHYTMFLHFIPYYTLSTDFSRPYLFVCFTMLHTSLYLLRCYSI